MISMALLSLRSVMARVAKGTSFWLGRRHIVRDCRGATAVEMAIALPIVLLMIFGVIEVAAMMWTQLTLSFAVQAAARCGAVNAKSCGSAASIESYAASQAFAIPNLTSSNFTVKQAGSASCG